MAKETSPHIDEKAAKVEIDHLIGKSEAALMAELAIRKKATMNDPSLEHVIALRVPADKVADMGVLDELEQFGRAVMVEWAKELQKLVCGDATADEEDRKKLRDAFGVSKTAGALILTSGLVAVGCPVAIAPVIAAVVMTRFVGKAVDVFCRQSQGWIDQLST